MLLLLISTSPLPPLSPVLYSSLNLIVVLTAARILTFLGSFPACKRREEYAIPKYILWKLEKHPQVVRVMGGQQSRAQGLSVSREQARGRHRTRAFRLRKGLVCGVQPEVGAVS